MKIWIVYNSADLYAGSGTDFATAFCVKESTARRIGKGAYVKGSNCPIKEFECSEFDGQFYIPVSKIGLMQPTDEDNHNQNLLDLRASALVKLRASGMTDDEMTALLGARFK